MNKVQKNTLITSALVALIMFLFPPYGIHNLGGTFIKHIGFHPIWNPPQYAVIQLEQLIIQILAVLTVSLVLFLIFKK